MDRGSSHPVVQERAKQRLLTVYVSQVHRGRGAAEGGVDTPCRVEDGYEERSGRTVKEKYDMRHIATTKRIGTWHVVGSGGPDPRSLSGDRIILVAFSPCPRGGFFGRSRLAPDPDPPYGMLRLFPKLSRFACFSMVLYFVFFSFFFFFLIFSI